MFFFEILEISPRKGGYRLPQLKVPPPRELDSKKTIRFVFFSPQKFGWKKFIPVRFFQTLRDISPHLQTCTEFYNLTLIACSVLLCNPMCYIFI